MPDFFTCFSIDNGAFRRINQNSDKFNVGKDMPYGLVDESLKKKVSMETLGGRQAIATIKRAYLL